ncbi:DUF1295 domain-containing protein, partial [Rhizobium sp. Rhizsp42]|uniref:DUF1295 domain-containing protein n=1 Tax=Rhizobium sp. Rhizsp42 TaxID=3243034 RepID=UPI0039B0676D
MDILLLVVIAIWLSLAMSSAWVIQRSSGQSGWIDTIWSVAVGIGGVVAASFAGGDFNRRVALLIVICA